MLPELKQPTTEEVQALGNALSMALTAEEAAVYAPLGACPAAQPRRCYFLGAVALMSPL